MESESRPVTPKETAGKAVLTPLTEGNMSRTSRESSGSAAFTIFLGTSPPPGSGTVFMVSNSSSKSSRDFPPASNSVLDSFKAIAAAFGVASEKSSKESRPSRASSAVEVKVGAPTPTRNPEVNRSSRVSSVAEVVLQPPPGKESRELSGLTAELKKAGGSCGVGAGRTDVTVCLLVGVWKTWRGIVA